MLIALIVVLLALLVLGPVLTIALGLMAAKIAINLFGIASFIWAIWAWGMFGYETSVFSHWASAVLITGPFVLYLMLAFLIDKILPSENRETDDEPYFTPGLARELARREHYSRRKT